MGNRVAAIARYTALEALRTKLPLLATVLVAVLLAASFFVREIAIAESVRFQAAFYAATARFATVFLIALYVIASVSREFNDKGLELVLALDLPRAHYVIGKLAGFTLIAWALALAAALPLLPFTGWDPLAQWTISLAVELAVVVALSLFCAITFNQLLPAASFVLAFYLFARTITAVRLIGGNPIADADALSHRVMTWLVETLAFVVPAFDAWTRTSWLVDEAPSWTGIALITAHGALFLGVVTAAAVFDLYRKNF